MTETRRQVGANLAALADNVTEDISPEKIRDAFLSNVSEFIQFHVPPGSLPLGVVIPAASGWVDITPVGLITASENWTPAGIGIQYTGVVNVGLFGLVAVSFLGVSQRELYEFRLLRNGAQDDGSVVQIPVGANGGGRAGHGVIPVSLSMMPGDVLVAQVRQLTGQDDIDITAYSGWWITRPS